MRSALLPLAAALLAPPAARADDAADARAVIEKAVKARGDKPKHDNSDALEVYSTVTFLRGSLDIEKLLREMFEGHEKLLGVTPRLVAGSSSAAGSRG